MKKSAAEVIREYGPFPGVEKVHGVSYDGQHVWFASGDKLNALDPASGKTLRSIDVDAHAGTAFDGRHFYQLAEDRIQKIDPENGQVVATIPAPGGGGDSGLTWAEGSLWVGQYRSRKIHQIDPETGEVLRTIESNRFVTGVTWVDGELWHATWEGDQSDLRRIARTLPLSPPPQKNRSPPSDSNPDTPIPGGISNCSSTSPVRGSIRLTSLSSPSHVACQSSPSTHVTPVTNRFDSIVRSTAPVSGST